MTLFFYSPVGTAVPTPPPAPPPPLPVRMERRPNPTCAHRSFSTGLEISLGRNLLVGRNPLWCDMIILSYDRMTILSSYHIIILSSDHNTEWLKSFLVPSLGFQHILSRLPPFQGSLPKNKGSSGNNFLRPTCQRGSKNHSSSKTLPFWKKRRPRFFLLKFYPKKNSASKNEK